MATLSLLPVPWRRLARRSVALFGLCAAWFAGCAGAGAGDPAGPGQPPGDDDPDAVPADQAFFTLHGTDIRSAGWPGNYSRFSLFVCDPSLTAEQIAEIRADIPGARLLAYFNIQDIPLHMYPGNPYHAALDAVFDSSLCMINLDDGSIVHVQGYTGVPGSGQPHYVLRPESVEILVAFHRDVTMSGDWDGMYLDQCTGTYPTWRREYVLDQTLRFDANGDGLPDRMDDVIEQYLTYRPEFTRRLREEIGDDKVLVGNSGGALVDPELNGITLEGAGDRFTVADARGILAGQQAVSRSPLVSVLWATTPASEGPSAQLAAEFTHVLYGIIDPGG